MPSRSATDPRPASAVSTGVGVAGLVGLVLWTIFAWNDTMDGPFAAMTAVLACGIPMLLWSLLVDRVHRSPTTGIDWDQPLPPLSETWRARVTNALRLWTAWGLIALFYGLGRWYWAGPFLFAMRFMMVA